MQPIEGRSATVRTDLCELSFIVPTELTPYDEMDDVEYMGIYATVGRVAYRMALIHTAVLLQPDYAELVDNVLKTCASMIKEELEKDHVDPDDLIDKLKKMWEADGE